MSHLYRNIIPNCWPFLLFKIMSNYLMKDFFELEENNANLDTMTITEKMYIYLSKFYRNQTIDEILFGKINDSISKKYNINPTRCSEFDILNYIIVKTKMLKKHLTGQHSAF